MYNRTIYRSNYEGKEKFIEEVVNPLLLNSELEYSAVYYKPKALRDDEYIQLYDSNGVLRGTIDITCDSISAIIIDVVKYLSKNNHF
jgi:hypothetical protein